jgi:hypothetical protein
MAISPKKLLRVAMCDSAQMQYGQRRRLLV